MRKYTILLATYNGEKYIKEFLDSLKNQSYTNWDLVVFDDESTDETVNIINEFKKNVSNEITVKVNNPGTKSAKKNFIELLKYAAKEDSIEYVFTADQDDYWHEDKISEFDKFIDKLISKTSEEEVLSKPILIHSDLRVVDEKLETIAESMFEYANLYKNIGLRKLIVQNNVTGCAMLVNKALLKGIYEALNKDSDKIIMHDYFLAIYAKVFGEMYFIDKALVSYRQHSDNSVGAKGAHSVIRLLKRLKEGKSIYRAQMEESYIQAEYFYNCFSYMVKGPTDEIVIRKLRFIRAYGELKDSSSFKRKNFFASHKVYKKGFIRRIMQMMYS
ncbi:MAG: glycosyltransferase family 2 protein [Lachnospiraceae bacterium]|nr:glycosyltransferase family 2 protein [Lachnospiraceae bacterium]